MPYLARVMACAITLALAAPPAAGAGENDGVLTGPPDAHERPPPPPPPPPLPRTDDRNTAGPAYGRERPPPPPLRRPDERDTAGPSNERERPRPPDGRDPAAPSPPSVPPRADERDAAGSPPARDRAGSPDGRERARTLLAFGYVAQPLCRFTYSAEDRATILALLGADAAARIDAARPPFRDLWKSKTPAERKAICAELKGLVRKPEE